MPDAAVGRSSRGAVAPPPELDGGSPLGRSPWHLPVGTALPGLTADAARVGALEVRAASVVGASHRYHDPAVPRQDAYALRRTADGAFLVVAVADGVAASADADLGARVAVTTASRLVVREIEEHGDDVEGIDPTDLFLSVADEMLWTAQQRDIARRQIYTTLVVTVLPTWVCEDAGQTVWTAQVGDVSTWRCGPAGFVQETGPVKAGLDRNVVRDALPDVGEVVWRSWCARPGEQVVIMTDGVSDALADVPLARDLLRAQWSGAPPHPAVFLHALAFDAPGQYDDRTAVVVWTDAQADGARGGPS